MLLQNDKKTNKLRYYQTAVASILDKGSKVKKKKKIHYMTVRNVCVLLFASFHFITTFTAFVPFKGTQSYSKSG